ncbi:MAG: biopolymer transporter ExbD [Lentisphaeria bacterium]
MRKRSSSSEGSTPVASLIDVVFLLIIFFVVTAAADKEVVDESINLAQAKYAAAIEKEPPTQITINVRDNGNMNIANVPITESQLSYMLQSHWNAGERDLPILIRADAETEYRHIDKIQNIIKENGFIRVKLAARAQ